MPWCRWPTLCLRCWTGQSESAVVPPAWTQPAAGPRADKAVGRDEIVLSQVMHEVTMYYPMRTLRDRRYKLIGNIYSKVPWMDASEVVRRMARSYTNQAEASFGVLDPRGMKGFMSSELQT